MGKMITQLFRPVGIQEMQKICSLGLRGFPPRLPEQPIFYPVTNQEYAAKIARDWNTKDPYSGYCGFVTSFDVDTDYLQQFKVQQVGTQVHQEYWIPAEKLDEFNRHIIGVICVEEAFYGERYDGLTFDFKGKAVEEQIDLLEQMGIG